MSDTPHFPPPPATSTSPSKAPYREPAERPSVVLRAGPREPPPPAVDKGVLYAALAEERESARRRQRRGGFALACAGLALAAAAVALSVASKGGMIFHGLLGVGVLLVARGFERLLRSLFA